jgi:hypothetical protein
MGQYSNLDGYNGGSGYAQFRYYGP